MDFKRSFFNGVQVFSSEQNLEVKPTIVSIAEPTDKGVVIVRKCLEQMLEPSCVLDFSDYALNNLLAAGISPKSIKISSDIRIGSDEIIERFNERVDALSEQIFNN